MLKLKKKDMTQTCRPPISHGIVLCKKVGIKMLYSCQIVSLSKPLFSAELTIQKYCLLADSLFPSVE